MAKNILRPLAVIAALGFGFAGWRWATEWRFVESTDDAYVEGDITSLSPKVAAHVTQVAVTDNQPVKAGDVLVRLDERDYRTALAEAKAVAAARNAALLQLEDRLAVQTAAISQAAAGISAARADVARSKADLDRARKLVQEEFLSRQRFDSQSAEAAKATATLQGSAALADGARRQMAVLESERQVARAQLDQALARVDQAQLDLDSTIIRAPVDGVIGNRTVREGQYARPGQHLLSVVPLASVWVDANFKETQIGRMVPGTPVSVHVDAYPDVTIQGRLGGFSPASGAKFSLLPPENATGNFTKVVQRIPVRVTLPADHALVGKLYPGLSVMVRVDTRAP